MEGPDGIVYRDAAVPSTLVALATKARTTVQTWLDGPGESDDPFEALVAVCDYEGALADDGEDVTATAAVAGGAISAPR
jgi:hypothetical protein